MGLSTSVFADDLYQVYQMAVEKDPTTNRAKADRDAAFEGISISRANLLPQVSGSVSYSDSTSEQFDFQPVPDTAPVGTPPVINIVDTKP